MSDNPSYRQVFMNKVWHNACAAADLFPRPRTGLQWLSFSLHLGVFVAFITPCIAAWGHITNLEPIHYSGVATVNPALVTKFLHIALQFLSTIFCVALLAVVALLNSQDRADAGKSNWNLFWRLRIVPYFILVVTLNAVMAVVVQFKGTQTMVRKDGAFPSRFINTYDIRVDGEPYYICLWLSIAIALMGATYTLERKRSIQI